MDESETSMTEIALPYIRFGRQVDTARGDQDYYAVLYQSPAIPAAAVETFKRKVSKSVQWDASGGEECFPDCFLFWRIDAESFWLARLSDAGDDSRGRPHSMRIEALYLEDRIVSELPGGAIPFSAWLCRSSSWADDFRDDAYIFSYYPHREAEHRGVEEELSSFFESAEESPRSLLVARHPHYMARDIDVRIDDYQGRTTSYRVQQAKETSPPIDDVDTVPPPSPRQGVSFLSRNNIMKKIPCRILVTLLLGIGCITMVILLYNSRAESKRLSCEFQKKTQEFDNAQKRVDKLEADLETVKEQKADLTTKLSKSEGKWKKDIDNLKMQLKQATQDADESLRKQNEELEKQNSRLKKAYEEFYTEVGKHFKKFETLLNSSQPESWSEGTSSLESAKE